MTEKHVYDDEFSEEEQRAFDEMTKGLKGEEPVEPARHDDVKTEARQDVKEEAKPEAKPDEPEDGEITVDEDGRARQPNGRFANKYVPHKTYHSERERRKGAEAELSRIREEKIRSDEQLAILKRAYEGESKPEGKPADDSEAPIDPNVDFIGAVAQLQKWQKEYAEKTDKRHEESREQDARRLQWERWGRDIHAYGQQQPEFQAAVGHLLSTRHKMLELEGVAEKEVREEILKREEHALFSRAYAEGRNPAETVWQMAQIYGYKPGDKAAIPPSFTPAEHKDMQRGATSFQVENTPAGQRIASINEKMAKAGGSLSNAHGSGGDFLSAQQLANMSEEEHDAYFDRIGQLAYEKRYMGRM
jgi:hypothetical protein